MYLQTICTHKRELSCRSLFLSLKRRSKHRRRKSKFRRKFGPKFSPKFGSDRTSGPELQRAKFGDRTFGSQTSERELRDAHSIGETSGEEASRDRIRRPNFGRRSRFGTKFETRDRDLEENRLRPGMQRSRVREVRQVGVFRDTHLDKAQSILDFGTHRVSEISRNTEQIDDLHLRF